MSRAAHSAQSSKNGGFTLIELLVTTAITAMILLTASSILMTFFVSNSRTTLRRQIKAEGNRALSRIEFIARGAADCSNPAANTIVFTYADETGYQFSKNVNNNLVMQKLDSTGATVGNPESLLTNFVIAQGTDFSMQCSNSGTSKKYANIRYFVTTAASESQTIKEEFTTLVSLRNSR